MRRHAIVVVAAAALALALALALPIGAAGDETIVTIPSGTLQGEITDDSTARVFRGVPYAAPPVSQLRFSPPSPVQSWQGVLQATTDGAACMQSCSLQSFACPTVMSEDCLYLNVFTPRADSIHSPLPVMVFLHGGNFFEGYGGGPLYDARYAANHTATIVVTINYRLGIIGFLASDTVQGNFGLMDQLAAMKWVQANIQYFGGDPTKVTLFGQSAGAMSASIHIFSPAAKGLFSKVIMESQPFGLPMRTLDSWNMVASAFASLVNCSGTDMNCIRALSAQQVLDAQNTLMTDILVDLDKLLQAMLVLFVPFTPLIGSDLAPMQPLDAFIAGKEFDVPIMLGNTAQEAVGFVYQAFSSAVPPWEYDVALDVIFGLVQGTEIAIRYPTSEPSDCRPTMSVAATDGIFLCPNRNVTRAIANLNRPVWYYMFDHAAYDHAAWDNATWCYNVSCHGIELPFVFHSFFHNVFNWTAAEAALSVSMVDYWTNFAHNGDPNIPNPHNKRLAQKLQKQQQSQDPQWPIYVSSTSMNINFTIPTIEVEAFFNGNQCDWWDTYIGYNFIN